MTPRQYDSLLKQHKHRIRHDELLTAIIASTIVNTSMAAPEKPAPLTTFMPSEWPKAKAKKPREKRVTKAEREAIARKVHFFFAARSDNPPPRTPDAR
jgi:hypothetical protein